MKTNGQRVLEEVNTRREQEEERRQKQAATFTNDVLIESASGRNGPAGISSRVANSDLRMQGKMKSGDGYGRRYRKRLGVVARNTLEAYYQKDKHPSVRVHILASFESRSKSLYFAAETIGHALPELMHSLCS